MRFLPRMEMGIETPLTVVEIRYHC